MGDPILEARIDALLKSLERPMAISNFVRGLDSGYSHLDQFKWGGIKDRLAVELERGIDSKIGNVRNIRKQLQKAPSLDSAARAEAVSRAWAEYRDVLEQIQGLFRECLDVLGGLAFHEQSLKNPTFSQEIDKNILSVAEELIWACSTLTGISSSLVIPAPEEAWR